MNQKITVSTVSDESIMRREVKRVLGDKEGQTLGLDLQILNLIDACRNYLAFSRLINPRENQDAIDFDFNFNIRNVMLNDILSKLRKVIVGSRYHEEFSIAQLTKLLSKNPDLFSNSNLEKWNKRDTTRYENTHEYITRTLEEKVNVIDLMKTNLKSFKDIKTHVDKAIAHSDMDYNSEEVNILLADIFNNCYHVLNKWRYIVGIMYDSSLAVNDWRNIYGHPTVVKAIHEDVKNIFRYPPDIVDYLINPEDYTLDYFVLYPENAKYMITQLDDVELAHIPRKT